MTTGLFRQVTEPGLSERALRYELSLEKKVRAKKTYFERKVTHMSRLFFCFLIFQAHVPEYFLIIKDYFLDFSFLDCLRMVGRKNTRVRTAAITAASAASVQKLYWNSE